MMFSRNHFIHTWSRCAERILPWYMNCTRFFRYLYSQNPEKIVGSMLIGPKLCSSLHLVSYWLWISWSPMLIRCSCLGSFLSPFPEQVSLIMPGVIFGVHGSLMVIDGRYFFCIFCAAPSLLRCSAHQEQCPEKKLQFPSPGAKMKKHDWSYKIKSFKLGMFANSMTKTKSCKHLVITSFFFAYNYFACTFLLCQTVTLWLFYFRQC